MPGNENLRESHSAQWFRARLHSTDEKAAQEADHFMQMTASEPHGLAKPYIQVSGMHVPGNLLTEALIFVDLSMAKQPDTILMMVYTPHRDPVPPAY